MITLCRLPYESPCSEEVTLYLHGILCQSSNTEPIGGGDDPDINWGMYKPGDIFDLL